MPATASSPGRPSEAVQGLGRHVDDRPVYDRARPAAGANMAAPVAAGLVVLVCIVARFPDHLLRAIGVRGWAPALIAVMALVNGARVVTQAPFTVAHRDVSPARWGADQAKTLASMIVVGAAFTIPLYALLRATSWWWLWAWALFAAVTVGAQAAMPLILRAQVGPLSPVSLPLGRQVAVVAARAGVDVGEVLLATRSTGRGPRCNAYVVGWGTTRRVVLETGIASWAPELIDQVMAHEIGHWRLRHTARRLPVALSAQLATFVLAGAIVSFRPLLDLAGVAQIGDPRSYPLLLALTAVLVLPARLVLAAYDRRQERHADRFALHLLGDPASFAAMLDRAARDGDAARRLRWWRYWTASHPPIDERILACQPLAPAR